MSPLRWLAGLGMVLALAAGCASPPPDAPAVELYPDGGAPDAGATDAGAVPHCCRLDNARGERLAYQCGTAIDTGWLEARGYRCWLAQ